MGLTNQSVGSKAAEQHLVIEKRSPNDWVIALAGNPNVGKSTVFNGLTGMNQHTGNWPGKTVVNAQGYCASEKYGYVLVDIPGTYSLLAHSAEEEVARDFVCFGQPDGVAVVCDATCLERNLNLVLQVIEATPKVVVCVNLLDEAKRKHIHLNIKMLSEKLGVPVVGTIARKKQSLSQLLKTWDTMMETEKIQPMQVQYPAPVEEAIAILEPVVTARAGGRLPGRWLSLRLLEPDTSLSKSIADFLGIDLLADPAVHNALCEAWKCLEACGIRRGQLQDQLVTCLVQTAEALCKDVLQYDKTTYNEKDRKLDRVLTSRWAGYPIMLALLAGIFWLTITGANYPSQLLAQGFFWVQDRLTELFRYLHAPDWLRGVLVDGMFRVLAWVVSVMLPPMAIFFPLFTLLEDVGYLPRIAYNLDKPFKCCRACGKQALTMCMGFGCNAAGVVGCRIIDSPRERMIAILTNSFVPCNGRFPTIIAILTMFFVGTAGGMVTSLLSAGLLTLVIVFGVLMTFLVSKLLSVTILRGIPSSFTLEMPPYRRPQIGKVIVRSVFDRTLFVLGRSAAVAAPAGVLIWLLANITVGDISLLGHCASFLDPFAKQIGLDGVILLAFILGLPANEIVVPIIIMAYMAQGSLLELESIWQMQSLFAQNGWTWITAVNVILFSLMHWPCSTTLLTIHKETGSWKWTALALAIPTASGVAVCFCFTQVARLFL